MPIRRAGIEPSVPNLIRSSTRLRRYGIDSSRAIIRKKIPVHCAKSCAQDSNYLRGQCAKSGDRPGKILRTTNNKTIRETISKTTAPPSPLSAGGHAPAVLAKRISADVRGIEDLSSSASAKEAINHSRKKNFKTADKPSSRPCWQSQRPNKFVHAMLVVLLINQKDYEPYQAVENMDA